MKKQRGITLVGLIITIIILLILAGVSIGILSGENGLIKKSQTAVRVYNESEVLEELQHKILALQIDIEMKRAEGNQNVGTALEEFLTMLQNDSDVYWIYTSEQQSTASIMGDVSLPLFEQA